MKAQRMPLGADTKRAVEIGPIPRGSRIRWGFTIFWLMYFSWFIGCVAVPAVRLVMK